MIYLPIKLKWIMYKIWILNFGILSTLIKNKCHLALILNYSKIFSDALIQNFLVLWFSIGKFVSTQKFIKTRLSRRDLWIFTSDPWIFICLVTKASSHSEACRQYQPRLVYWSYWTPLLKPSSFHQKREKMYDQNKRSSQNKNLGSRFHKTP